ncbi:Golgi-associated plant pathogenesis-related protein 1-like [Sabethes cyaneus]|uniref:Golgi-associated plant pathogenesis-related protein 1-like n=1 Tax=Sabethes cyaneus TaxID=53552 RepID=UPI00237E8B36|nr:Golgi-associated plant pathogenesis-related protein 1-like [Sabethes cyaneus]
MSYTRKVTVVRQGCSGQRVVTVTQQSSGGCTGSFGTQFGNYVQQFEQQTGNPAVTWTNTCQGTVQTPEKVQSAPCGQKTSSLSSSSSSSSFEDAVLEEHNRLRARHSAAPLRLNASMSQYAQEWANNLASRNTMQHRSNNRYGENLYASFGKSEITGEEAVRSWYDEIKYYRFGQSNPGNFSQVGHFTQLVWKGSQQLGVGKARNGNNIYVVCNYDPPGNYSGQYAGNVSPN